MTREEELIAASEAAAEESQSLREKLRYRCLKKGYNGILAVGRFVRKRDTNDTKTLHVEEITEALQEAGVEVDEDEAQDLFKSADSAEEGVINYEDFLNTIRPTMPDVRKEVVEQAFEKLDETGDCVVTLEDIRGKYDASQHPKVVDGTETEDQILERFLNRFEGNTQNDGQVTKNEFLDYYSALSEAIQDDEYFVEMIRSCWKLD